MTINPRCKIGKVKYKTNIREFPKREIETDETVFEDLVQTLEIARDNRTKFFATLLIHEDGAITTAYSGEPGVNYHEIYYALDFLKDKIVDRMT